MAKKLVLRQKPVLPDNFPDRFSTILMDPPWPELGGKGRGADSKYNVIRSREKIRDVILESGVWRPADSAHLYMWITNNFVPWGVWLFEELGFEIKTNFPWVKNGNAGLGQYAKGCHEILFVGDRGESAPCDGEPEEGGPLLPGLIGASGDETELLFLGVKGRGYDVITRTRSIRTDYLVGASTEMKGPLRKHSAKPPRQYTLIESRSRGPYLEMFCRSPRPGWWSWGDQL